MLPALLLALQLVGALADNSTTPLSCASRSPCKEVTVGYLTALRGDTKERQGIVISGAISYALEKINNDSSMLPNVHLKLKYSDTQGETVRATRIMTDMICEGVGVFIGPEGSCHVEAIVAWSQNKPMISYKCPDAKASKVPTFARTEPQNTQVTKSIIALLRYYTWNIFSIIAEDHFSPVAETLEAQAIKNNMTVKIKRTLVDRHICCVDNLDCCKETFLYQLVEDTKNVTRIYVFLGAIHSLVVFMKAMESHKLFDDGEYIVISADMTDYNPEESYRYFWTPSEFALMRDCEVDEKTVKRAKSLLVVANSPPKQSYHEFARTVNEYSEKEPFNFPHPMIIFQKWQYYISIYAAYLYDSMQLYAKALDILLKQKENLTEEIIDDIVNNGTMIINALIEMKTYESITGAHINLDSNGDSEGNFSVVAYVPSNKTMKFLKCDFHMGLVGSFQSSSSGALEYKVQQSISWVAGEKPRDEPSCGFQNEHCSQNTDQGTNKIVAATLGILLFCTGVFTLSMYRKWKIEQEIEGLLWKVERSELYGYMSNEMVSSPSKMSLISATSYESRCCPQMFAVTGQYRNMTVRIKEMKFSKKKDISRDIMKEMRILRDLRHGNINSFLGACVEPMKVLILTEYCAKGSLYDIIENEDFKLDMMFIASLVYDLIKGMIFIHKSDLICHGNLKSSNCVVTSRWVLQLTDFGLHELRHCAESDSIGEHQHYRSLFWKAPEFLREEANGPVQYSQKGDVYAFAIILYEIIGRRGPFGGYSYEPKEIIELVKHVPDESEEPFRPDIGLLQDADVECGDYIISCIQDCWAENPDLRPDFFTIRTRLRKMRDGMHRNIMDQMMEIMEKHATNLEYLVNERTRLLYEEKRKTEDLLHRMLPAPVAQQLTKGIGVEPEAFDLVTIYFSDIVGFTAMSAESTPFQVVTFLNDLYTLFDRIIKGYDVYKVETIGDAYMVVSGLPLKNGDRHAGEIASMALELLEAVKHHHIAHRPNETLKLRIGIHTGPVAAGVVGLTMPRYCLFGDTVNTASRMESNGEPLRIHISIQCKEALEKIGGYLIEERGLVSMKGKGEVQTYWLLGATEQAIQKREVDLNELPPLFCRPRRSPKLNIDSRQASICGFGAGSRRQSSIPRESSSDAETISILRAYAVNNSSPLGMNSQRNSSKRADCSPLYLVDCNCSVTTLNASAQSLPLEDECTTKNEAQNCIHRISLSLPVREMSSAETNDKHVSDLSPTLRETQSLDPFPNTDIKHSNELQLPVPVPKRSSHSMEDCIHCSVKSMSSSHEHLGNAVNNNCPNGEVFLINNRVGQGSSMDDIQTPLLRNSADSKYVINKCKLRRSQGRKENTSDVLNKRWRSLEEVPVNNVNTNTRQSKKTINRSSLRSWLVGLLNGNGLRTSDTSLRKGFNSGYSDLHSERESIV